MSNITCDNISQTQTFDIFLAKNNNYNQFEIFLTTIITLMPISKKYSQYIKIDVLRRKINQYTNWNILMIFVNSLLYNIFNIDNYLISRFIAINSIQIMSLFHLFVLYDSSILFYIMDATPTIFNHRIFSKISNNFLVRLEYFIGNIIIHILPVYFYKNYLILKNDNDVIYDSNNYKIHMFQYLIMFKFMWVLNIFGDFNITSIYVPKFEGCNIKLVNIVVIVDYISYKLINYFLYKI
jgi:hypothetical protein